MKPVIFTDLDGTLLDSSYSFEPATAALKRISEDAIPLALVTSKTRKEVERIRERLGNLHPFITENGGGVYVPRSYFPFPVKGEERDGFVQMKLGPDYGELRRALDSIRAGSGKAIKGFGDMTVEEVGKLTGLGPEEAALSKEREFDEPFVMAGSSPDEARKLVEAAGYSFTMGRLFHITGANDKGKAVDMLIAMYRALYGKIVTIGLGDGPNDSPFLRKVDYPVLVMNEDGGYNDVGEIPGLVRADGIGPSGWARAVIGILDSIRSSSEGYTC
ncbi:MAG: HAD-IIB family hydrolase [Deltaproteobacteria bacterium]|nr:HAD-IIB family hydrolase [Deltaproteobacteria bacterium]MBZ0219505.1 HAD-IIB family hydrolase [Deltaproteobacteria bacterium]